MLQIPHSAINESTIPWLPDFQTTDVQAHGLQQSQPFTSTAENKGLNI